jgi:hypothetical protein
MPDKPNNLTLDVPTLAVPGLLSVSIEPSGRKLVRVGPTSGWMPPAGIGGWERELSFMAREDMTADLARLLHATLPLEQVARARFPMAFKAIEASPFLAVAGNLVEAARKQGVCVHTVGVDRVSGDFFYFVEGGAREPVSVQGNLVEMLAPSLTASSSNADIESMLEGLIDRMLTSLSGGAVTELGVELAAALPRLSRDGTGLEGTDIEAFDAQARALADRSAAHLDAAQVLARTLAAADRANDRVAQAPVFGEALVDVEPALELLVGGKPLRLPSRRRWFATGVVRREVEAPKAAKVEPAAKPVESPKPAVAKADAPKAAEATKPVEKAVEPGKPFEPTKPAEAAKPVEAAKPAEAAKPVEATKPAARPRPAGKRKADVTEKVMALYKEESRAKAPEDETVIAPAPVLAALIADASAKAAPPPGPAAAREEAAAASSEPSAAPVAAEPAPAPSEKEPAEAPAGEPESGAFPEAPPPRASRRPARRRSVRPRASAKPSQPERVAKGSPIVKTLLLVAFAVTLYLSLMSALSAR